jgi:hypothetical protein
MKIASLISLVLAVALSLACSGAATNPGLANPGLNTVAIVVTQDPAQSMPTVQVTDPTYAGSKSQKIRWCVYNNTAQTVTRLAIVFTGASPCDNSPSLVLTNIPAGNDLAVCTDTCGCIATGGTFPYSINVTTGLGNPPSPNPRVILN